MEVINMCEKRFNLIIKTNGAYNCQCWLNDSKSKLDSIYDEGYYFRDDVKGAKMFCDLLNSQDAKIKELEHRIRELEHDV